MTLKYRLTPAQQDVLVAFAETGPSTITRLHMRWPRSLPPAPDRDRIRRAALFLERHKLLERHYHSEHRHAYKPTIEGATEARRLREHAR